MSTRRPPVVLAALLLLPLLAGCLAGEDSVEEAINPTEFPPEQGIPHGDGHDHADPELHRRAWHAELLMTDNLQRFGANEELIVGAHAAAAHGDILAVAVNGNHDDEGGQQGFHLFDITDPAAMVHLAFWDAGAPVRGDRTIDISDDGATVFLGYESGPRPGVAAVDITDPYAPAEIAFWEDPAGYGPHTVAAGTIDGTDYVFALSFGVTILSFDRDAGFTLEGRYITSDDGAIIDTIGHAEVDPTNPGGGIGYGQTYALRTVYGHDMDLYNDPVTGLPLLMVAYAYDGLKILDLTTPSAPVPVARWMPEADTAHRHYVHSVSAERIDDRLIVVVGSETFEPDNQPIASPIWILDATDAVADADPVGRPTHLGTWRNPSDAPSNALNTSVHFFRQQDGFLYLSHYHGGVWAIDLREESGRTFPHAFAYITPVPENPITPPDDCCIGFPLRAVPMVFDVAVDSDGNLYAADLVQGISSIRIQHPA